MNSESQRLLGEEPGAGHRATSGQQCTIVIPTYNRPEYLSRTLRYLANLGNCCPIIIADSGSEENQTISKEIASACSSLDITYRAYPRSAESFGGFESKIVDALSHCDTEYCVICPDDDLVTPRGISHCVNFLQHNSGFAVAHGEYLYFWTEDRPRSHRCLYWKPAYQQKSLASWDAGLRLKFHLSNYPDDTTMYGVHQTALLRHILQQVVDSGLQSVVLRELYSSGITVIHGKTMYLNVLYSAKDHHSRRLQYIPDIIRLRATPTYDREQSKFTEALALYLAEHSTMSIEASKTTVDAALSAYVNRQASAAKQKKYVERSVISARESLSSRGLGWVYDYVRKAYRTPGQYWIMVRGRVDWMNYGDFKTISHLLLSGPPKQQQPRT